jgi:epoxyqueuosine reductase
MTIETKGSIPTEHRAAIGEHAYGCDICQDVCPWNRRAAVSEDAPWQARDGLAFPSLLSLWERSDDDLRRLLKGSPIKRAGVRRLRRNLAVALGNSGDAAAAGPLEASPEQTAADPLVREHVAWAVEKLRGQED